MVESTKVPGTVYLVGAGPGDPGLITLRGVECLRKADVVLYDYLASPALLDHASERAELVRLGHAGGGRSLTPDEITARMLAEAKAGRTVVRLKGGDPSVFGRAADETDALRAAGVPFEIVPGITTGLAVAAYCEIPITHHAHASAVALIAGRERDDKADSALDLQALARFPGTLVFYMGVGRVAQWSTALITSGKPATTPVAIVRWCTRAQQQVYRCTLDTVADEVREKGIRAPAVFVVGDVVRHAPDVSWFAARPLASVRVLLPGSPGTSDKLRAILSDLGAEVITRPAIRITEPDDWTPVDEALDNLARYDWLVFSSANGVDYLLRRVQQRGGDVRRLAGVRLAAIGSGTADRLAEYQLRADLVPDRFVAESLAEALLTSSEKRRFLLARASRGRQVLAEELVRSGSFVDQVVVYTSRDVEEPDQEVAAQLESGSIDWVAVTSSSAARSLDQLYGQALRSARIASIGPITSATLVELGYEPAVEAAPQTAAGLAAGIRRLMSDE